MPSLKDSPSFLRPFIFHGIDLSWGPQDTQARGECPFCGKDGKFYVSIADGRWDCKVCGEGTTKGGGNIYTFLNLLWNRSDEATSEYSELMDTRGFLFSESIEQWGVAKSIITGEWLVPSYNGEGKLNQILRYTEDKEGRMVLWGTPGCNHGIHGMPLYDKSRSIVYLCEGIWDAIALWEVFRQTKRTDMGGFIITGAEGASLLGDANVLATPSCSVFNDNWLNLFADKVVCLPYDNDHPRIHPITKKVQEPVGWHHMQRVAGILARAPMPPSEIHFIKWGEAQDAKFNPELSDGYDVRDHFIMAGSTLGERIKVVGSLLEKIVPCPGEWLGTPTGEAGKVSNDDSQCLPCTTWKELVNDWRKAMQWIDELDHGLACCLACVTSTEAKGDQLWIKLISTPSSGKSVLCDGLTSNRRYVKGLSKLSGFHSGYKSDRDGEEDNSLIPMIDGKTLVTKDGDTLLQTPDLGRVLAEARDLFDGSCSAHYRNKINREHRNIRTTWILAGTEGLRALDSSELGERFLDVVMVERMAVNLERDISRRKAWQMAKQVTEEADGSLDLEETNTAKQRTGGYVSYLRQNAKRLLSALRITEAPLWRCQTYAEFVSFFRARPSRKQEESTVRELSVRLTGQLVRMATCLAVVLNREELDSEVMRRVRQVALDTARGKTLEIAKHLYKADAAGASKGTLAIWINFTDDKAGTLLQFMRGIGVVEHFRKKLPNGNLSNQVKWRLTERIHGLFEEIYDAPDSTT